MMDYKIINGKLLMSEGDELKAEEKELWVRDGQITFQEPIYKAGRARLDHLHAAKKVRPVCAFSWESILHGHHAPEGSVSSCLPMRSTHALRAF